ncbi:S-adenosyl-L-methionine-dependent methyltransferase [Podospora conica]|nr:S-adenosyl-L-methionine-dependent methyltransferase [Schizothecium conicum]
MASPTPTPAPASAPAAVGEDGILPAQHWAQLQQTAREGDTDGDSAVASNSSSTESLTESILEYRKLHGRTYHGEKHAEYWGPVDSRYQEALDINHHVLTMMIGGKLHLAPLDKGIKKVVDIGTGTGIWAMDFADQYPSASVVGTDISPTQPSWVPPNLEFQIDDCTAPWTFAPNSLDYIHMRWLVGAVQDWPALYAQAFAALKPGGWLESYEPASTFESDDGTVTADCAVWQWTKIFIEGGKKLGRSFTIYEDGVQRRAMEEVGFGGVQAREVKCPVGTWPKDPAQREVGAYMQLAFEQDAEGTVLFMATTLGWTREEVGVFLAQFRREIRSKKVHGYFRQRVVWGQKPL